MVRQIIPEDLPDKSKPYNIYALNLILEEIDWFLNNFKEIGLIFAKMLRILSYCLASEMAQATTIALKITGSIWQNRKEGKKTWESLNLDCVKLGPELIRLLQDLYKAKEMEFVTNDLKEPYKNSRYITKSIPFA